MNSFLEEAKFVFIGFGLSCAPWARAGARTIGDWLDKFRSSGDHGRIVYFHSEKFKVIWTRLGSFKPGKMFFCLVVWSFKRRKRHFDVVWNFLIPGRRWTLDDGRSSGAQVLFYAVYPFGELRRGPTRALKPSRWLSWRWGLKLVWVPFGSNKVESCCLGAPDFPPCWLYKLYLCLGSSLFLSALSSILPDLQWLTLLPWPFSLGWRSNQGHEKPMKATHHS